MNEKEAVGPLTARKAIAIMNSRIPCALCDSPANEFCTVEIPVEGLGSLAVYFCEYHFEILTPRFIEFGYMRYATRRDDNREDNEI